MFLCSFDFTYKEGVYMLSQVLFAVIAAVCALWSVDYLKDYFYSWNNFARDLAGIFGVVSLVVLFFGVFGCAVDPTSFNFSITSGALINASAFGAIFGGRAFFKITGMTFSDSVLAPLQRLHSRRKMQPLLELADETKWASVGRQLRAIAFDLIPRLQETLSQIEANRRAIHEALERHEKVADDSGTIDRLKKDLTARSGALSASSSSVSDQITRCQAFLDLVRVRLQTAGQGAEEPSDIAELFERLTQETMRACDSVAAAEAELETADAEVSEAVAGNVRALRPSAREAAR